MKNIVFIIGVLILTNINIFSYSNDIPPLHSYLYISPQIKFGKMENGNGFSELQYFKFRYKTIYHYSIEGSVSTSFTSPRGSLTSFNHSVNRIWMKFTYRPFHDVGFFVEGSLVDNIPQSDNAVDYIIYQNYQAVGISFDIDKFNFTF